MEFEIRRYHRRNDYSVAIFDLENSTHVREISNDEANQYIHFCELFGMKRHETTSQIFYDKVIDCNNSEEIIFYKR